jgi:hypothetical protein
MDEIVEKSSPKKRVRFSNHDEYIEDERRLFPYFLVPPDTEFYPESSLPDISAASENDGRNDQEESSLCIDDIVDYEDAVQMPSSSESRDFNEALSDIDQTNDQYFSDNDSDQEKNATRELLATPIAAVAAIGAGSVGIRAIEALTRTLDGNDAADEDDIRAAMVLYGKEGSANLGAGQGSGGGGGGGPATP